MLLYVHGHGIAISRIPWCSFMVDLWYDYELMLIYAWFKVLYRFMAMPIFMGINVRKGHALSTIDWSTGIPVLASMVIFPGYYSMFSEHWWLDTVTVWSCCEMALYGTLMHFVGTAATSFQGKVEIFWNIWLKRSSPVSQADCNILLAFAPVHQPQLQ